MKRCEGCGKSLAGRTARARFCNSTCRMRALRDGPAVVRELSRDEQAHVDAMEALCRRELAELGCADGSGVEAQVILVRLIVDPRTSSSVLASCVKELRRTWPKRSEGQPSTDELTRRRHKRNPR
jgi:hypothetical protein